jgi:hypothetical protein
VSGGRYRVRRIRGARADLTTVRGAERLDALEVRGAGVASLRGLERMGALEYLGLHDVAMTEIDLRGLRALRFLSVHVARRPLTLTGLDGLARLERAAVTGAILDDATVRALLALPALRQASLTPATRAAKQAMWDAKPPALYLVTDENGNASDVVVRDRDGWRFTTDLQWAWGIRRWDAVVPAAAAAAAGLDGRLEPAGTWVSFTATDRATVEAFRDAVDAITRERGGPEPGTLPGAPRLGRIQEPDGRPAVLTLDLAGLLGAETNHQAERRLRAALPPELAARLDWDTEAGEVVVLATAVEDLEAVQRVIATLAS